MGVSTEVGLRLERLRSFSQTAIHATRCDPHLDDAQKKAAISQLRSEHAARARTIMDEGEPAEHFGGTAFGPYGHAGEGG